MDRSRSDSRQNSGNELYNLQSQSHRRPSRSRIIPDCINSAKNRFMRTLLLSQTVYDEQILAEIPMPPDTRVQGNESPRDRHPRHSTTDQDTNKLGRRNHREGDLKRSRSRSMVASPNYGKRRNEEHSPVQYLKLEEMVRPHDKKDAERSESVYKSPRSKRTSVEVKSAHRRQSEKIEEMNLLDQVNDRRQSVEFDGPLVDSPPIDLPEHNVNRRQREDFEEDAENSERNQSNDANAVEEIGEDKQVIGFGNEEERGFPHWIDFHPVNGAGFYGFGQTYMESLEWRNITDRYDEAVRNPQTASKFFFQQNVECVSICLLGEGTFAAVYEVWNRQGEPFAAKILNYRQNEAFKAELEAFRRIRSAPHPNLLRMIAQEKLMNGQDVFITRLMGPSLGAILKDANFCRYQQRRYERVSFPMNSVKNIGRQIVLAMRHLEQLRVFHLDLKPDNVFLVRGDNYIADLSSSTPEIMLEHDDIVVADFGCARFDEGKCNPKELLQTLSYRAPEIFFGTGFTNTTDVWSLAATLGELYSGGKLFMLNPGRTTSPQYMSASAEEGYPVDNEEEQDQFELIMTLVGDPISEELFKRIPKHGSRINVKKVTKTLSYRERHTFRWNHEKNRDSEDYRNFFDLLTEMLRVDDRKRLTFESVQNHIFFNTRFPELVVLQ